MRLVPARRDTGEGAPYEGSSLAGKIRPAGRKIFSCCTRDFGVKIRRLLDMADEGGEHESQNCFIRYYFVSSLDSVGLWLRYV